MDLGPEEVRVTGCLVEKQLTTPQQYPLTLNALVAACNQSSNRWPVTDYDDRTVQSALDTLKGKGLVRFVHPSHGRSVTRYKHVLDEALELEPRQLALVTTLMLRGPQTPGELRARTERTAAFADGDELENELEAMAAGGQPLVARLPREPGRREIRYSHLLGGEPEAVAAAPVSAADGEPRVDVKDELLALREEVASLRRDLDHVLGRLSK